MEGLKRLIKGFENAMTASAFAEEGDFKTAIDILNEGTLIEERTASRVDRSRAKATIVARGVK